MLLKSIVCLNLRNEYRGKLILIFMCVFLDHEKAVENEELARRMWVVKESAIDKSEAAITAALKNVYFAAKNDLANTMVPALNSLCLQQVVII